MIYILHGENTEASYQKLVQIQNQHKDYEKVYISTNSEEALYLNLFSEDFLQTKKLIICENFLSPKNVKKLKVDIFKKIPSEKMLIFWEKQEIMSSVLNKFKNLATVENFKLPTSLFAFLDSITNDPKKPIFFLKKLDIEKTSAISWHLANRLLLLILAKQNFNEKDASIISGRNLALWQWQKISTQAQNLNLANLKQMFLATLRIETLIKSGKTQIGENTLLTLMLAKYLTS